MKRRVIALSMMLAFVAAVSAARVVEAKEPKPEIMGIKIGMSADAARERLRKIGKLEKEERKQQEIWHLNADERFEYLIVGFDKEYKQVRYVTAKAREKGKLMRYDEVLDLNKAKKAFTPNNYKYYLDVAARDKRPGYTVTVRGTDPNHLRYYSIEKID